MSPPTGERQPVLVKTLLPAIAIGVALLVVLAVVLVLVG